MSCDVTERYTPRTPSHYCQIKYGGPFDRLLQLQPKVTENPSFEQEEFLCACHSEKKSFGFLKKGSARPSCVQLKWTFTCSNRYQTMNFFLEFVPMNLSTMEALRLRTIVETGNKANVYMVNICFITAFHFCFKKNKHKK